MACSAGGSVEVSVRRLVNLPGSTCEETLPGFEAPGALPTAVPYRARLALELVGQSVFRGVLTGRARRGALSGLEARDLPNFPWGTEEAVVRGLGPDQVIVPASGALRGAPEVG